jgi:hypothetical protein
VTVDKLGHLSHGVSIIPHHDQHDTRSWQKSRSIRDPTLTRIELEETLRLQIPFEIQVDLVKIGFDKVGGATEIVRRAGRGRRAEGCGGAHAARVRSAEVDKYRTETTPCMQLLDEREEERKMVGDRWGREGSEIGQTVRAREPSEICFRRRVILYWYA